MKPIALRTTLICTISIAAANALNAEIPSEQFPSNTYSVDHWWDSERGTFSPDVHPDNTVTFRVENPDAETVVLSFGEWTSRKYPLSTDESGIWSVTIGPVEPGIYSYNFLIDGVLTLDRSNGDAKIGTSVYGSVLEISGEQPRYDSYQNVPQGADHIHHFYSKNLDAIRRFHVHTPPGYDATSRRRYPVLYLRHGGGDTDASWTHDGRAGAILDNLIAKEKAVPMIIVMPDGLLDGSWAGGSDPKGIATLEHELYEDIIPIVRRNYSIKTTADHTAIAGLSMGGGQSLLMAFKQPRKYAWVGDFGSGLLSAKEFAIEDRIPGILDRTKEINDSFRLVYIACGRDDPRFVGHVEFARKLEAAGIQLTFSAASGGHEWDVWRQELSNFVQLIFQDSD